jgi:hypothetical protein
MSELTWSNRDLPFPQWGMGGNFSSMGHGREFQKYQLDQWHAYPALRTGMSFEFDNRALVSSRRKRLSFKRDGGDARGKLGHVLVRDDRER